MPYKACSILFRIQLNAFESSLSNTSMQGDVQRKTNAVSNRRSIKTMQRHTKTLKQYRIYVNECRIKSKQRRNNTSYKNIETVFNLRQRNAVSSQRSVETMQRHTKSLKQYRLYVNAMPYTSTKPYITH